MMLPVVLSVVVAGFHAFDLAVAAAVGELIVCFVVSLELAGVIADAGDGLQDVLVLYELLVICKGKLLSLKVICRSFHSFEGFCTFRSVRGRCRSFQLSWPG